jgi:hypothetical protein
MTPGDREELARTCRRARDLHEQALRSGKRVEWDAYERALADMHVMLTPGLVLQLLEHARDG